MWRKQFRTKQEALDGATAMAGEQPFKPAYIPMHGPGAKPLEKPDRSWRLGTKQKVAIAAALALVLGSGGFFIVHNNTGTSSPDSVSFGGPGDNDESSVLGADSYTVPNSYDSADNDVVGTPAGPTTVNNGSGLVINPRGTASASRVPARQTPQPNTASPAPATTPTPQSPAPAPLPAPAPNPQPQPQPTAYTVEYAGGGFKPTALSLKKGDSVTFVHRGNQEPFQPGCLGEGLAGCLAPGILAAGQSWTYTFSTPGSYTVQNTQNTAETITIIVAE